jgi:cytochrome c2
MAVTLTGGDPDNAPRLLRRYGCTGCHTISALRDADGKVAPPLDHLRQRVFIAGSLRNTPDNLVHWITSPESLSPHSAMPNTGITEPEARDIAAFLYAH